MARPARLSSTDWTRGERTERRASRLNSFVSMPLEERRARHQVLFQVISDNDLNSWGEHFLAALNKSGTPPPLHEQLGLGPAVAADIA